ncbi:HNH endonuclease family protein [Arcanobacterium haemolyticum]|uniref:GmrSD restriction endonucleases C-terminal domain-containing protein n=1 Tax=Arcanobacterium haemolyticum (strain ATCC 9345 / DSM 20595 / CCM 5947 / CCUG 17215 / LMG 16163 / NBRC 15585 / NCTC 8452 / 11018) TaxID=644284 RepID=D7BPC6_ARCHD|nr:HNH endonuclease family protein [Arcanobacterium haemolyticum]ACV96716.1 unknown [Arcanobacterium haemolyticum DSM 20595]ADH92775.1 Domain of unknown function DUF1994 [Arcanobacterium haemolyticum DSM 20595]SQH28478.1 Domain of uncharacterised function (DUF1994) [Arcanobacterium haemolyticum]
MRRSFIDKILFPIAIAAGLWLVVPGLGPDIAGMEERFGWKIGPDDWRGPLSQEPTFHISNPEIGALLDTIPIRHKQHLPRYNRQDFGQAWADVDRNGCDTRNDILARDLNDVRFKKGTHNCVVVAGKLNDPYTGKRIDFVRGQKTSTLIQIDHVVALSDAWKSGAWEWDPETRENFANDPENLLTVDGQANQDKGAANAAQWLPENDAFQCAYVERQLRVKARWHLSVTQNEHTAIARTLSHCY